MNKNLVLTFVFFLILIPVVLAVDTTSIQLERQQRLNFGHVLSIDSIKTQPAELVPGQPGKLVIEITNNGNFKLSDLRIELNLPEEISFYNDVDKRNIANLLSAETKEIIYEIVALPGTDETVYKASVTIEYLNYIGDENNQSNEIGIVVKSRPQIYAIIDSTELYKGNDLGEISIKFVNNEIGDIRFLTVELIETQDYALVSPSKEYIGDLDSDDFESVDFKIRLKNEKDKISVPIKASYKDKLNNPYEDEIELWLYLLDAQDAGVKKSNSWIFFVIILVVIAAGYILLRRRKKKKQ